MVTVGDDPLLGVVVEGRYKIESVIGQGSAGTVYKAVQELIGREVAIKVLHDYLVSDQEFIKRFTQEAKASSRLSHPNIITIYDFGTIPQGNRPYIAMDLLKGTPLSDLLGERNHLTVEETIPMFKQVCGALAEAHRQGVVHRDVKPENIVLVERSGQKLFPIVVDFGIARLVQEESDVARITRTGTVCGSPTYMSPEQCTSSKVDHRSDIYSLGVVIYETLTGEVPFLSDELVKVMAMHLSDPPKPLNSVRDDLHFSQALEDVVYKALQKNPDQRYQTMEEFSEALEKAGKAGGAAPELVAPVPKRPEITPGPLASDDKLQASDRAVAASKEANPRPPKSDLKPMDLASRALDELRTSGAYDEIQDGALARVQAARAAAAQAVSEYNAQTASTASSTNISHVNFQRGRVKRTWIDGIKDSAGKVFLALLAVGIVGGGIYAAQDPKIQAMIPGLKAASIDEAEPLYKKGKYLDVINIVKAYRAQNQGKMPKDKIEIWSKALVGQAKLLAKDKDYDKAMSYLDQIPQKSSQWDASRALYKRYQALAKDSDK
ncbi:MAG TPA: serine/threonine-protein kinase [Drouetiella sp.]